VILCNRPDVVAAWSDTTMRQTKIGARKIGLRYELLEARRLI
jgi:hypothetical protein